MEPGYDSTREADPQNDGIRNRPRPRSRGARSEAQLLSRYLQDLAGSKTLDREKEVALARRMRQAREAISTFYTSQRRRYRAGLEALGFELFIGDGGFYHWGRLPGGTSADAFNDRLFRHDAGILPGPLCDMERRKGAGAPLNEFMRFSFGPLSPDSFDDDLSILATCM